MLFLCTRIILLSKLILKIMFFLCNHIKFICLTQGLFQKINLAGGSPNYFSCLNSDVVPVLDPWICQFVFMFTKLRQSDCKNSEMCLTFQIRVVHFFGMLEKKSINRDIYVFFHKKISPQVYLIWVSKLDVPKIGIYFPNGPKIAPVTNIFKRYNKYVYLKIYYTK